MVNTEISATVKVKGADSVMDTFSKKSLQTEVGGFGSIFNQSIADKEKKSSDFSADYKNVKSRDNTFDYYRDKIGSKISTSKTKSETIVKKQTTEKIKLNAESVDEYKKQIRDALKADLGISDEELDSMLEKAGYSIMDLLVVSNLADFITMNYANADAMKLLTDSTVSELFSQVNESLKLISSSYADSLQITREELAQLIEQLQSENIEELPNLDDTLENLFDGGLQNIDYSESGTQDNILFDDVYSNDIENLSGENGIDSNELSDTSALEKLIAQERAFEQSENSPLQNMSSLNNQAGIVNEELENNIEDSGNSKTNLGNGSEELNSAIYGDNAAKQNAKNDNKDNMMNNYSNNDASQDILSSLSSRIDDIMAVKESFEPGMVSGNDIIRQIVNSIKTNVSQTTTSMELQLTPENLGKVSLLVTAKNGVITAQITASNEVVKNVIENQLIALKDNLNQQGLKVEAVEVTIASHGFETGKNLEGGNSDSRKNDANKNVRRLSLDSLNDLSEEELEEDEQLAVKMMLANGGNVDYHV